MILRDATKCNAGRQMLRKTAKNSSMYGLEFDVKISLRKAMKVPYVITCE